ncbi:MAG TPA: ATP-grasp domain-containing protein [Gemmatimonadaceae bacterium]|jgi:D-alanine-D-alanine ligase|nr:ATP-grasp domain-containing protein [Gemmatimonadaceae bacterium]
MNVALLHTKDAIEPPEDPVLGQIEDALRAGGHEPRRVLVGSSIEPVVRALTEERPDLVFNLAESFAGKSALESNIAALLNLLDLRYTGSSPAGLLVAGDKTLSKKVLSFHGIRTPEFATVYRGMVDWAGEVQFPLIVKPPQEDASLGITQKSIVRDVKELLEKIAELQSEYQQPALAEQFIDGREFYVGVLGNANARALPVIELDFSKYPTDRPRIASWEAKWGDEGDEKGAEFEGTESVFPESLPDELRDRLQKAAVDAFHALRLRDYARVDMRVTENGDVYVIEVNPNCYLEAKSEFARAAERDGLSYDALIAQIVELAGARYAR